MTLGATFKANLPKPLTHVTIRPELRYDAALSSDTTPFANQTSRDQITAGIDAIFEF